MTEDGKSELINHAAPGTDISLVRIRVSDEVDLRCICFRPAVITDKPPVLFLPGMGSVIDNFTGTIKDLTKDFKVYFLETREKSSSIVEGSQGYTVSDFSEDITGAIRELGLKEKEYILAGYSLCASAAAEIFKRQVEKKPGLLVLAEPVGIFNITAGELFIARWFRWSYRLIKPVIKYYIKVRRVNSEGDYEMYRIICRALDAADPVKLARTVAGISGYSIYKALGKIDVPTIVIGTSLDKFHGNNEQADIARAIRGAEYYDLENNIRSHSSEVGEIIRGYLERS